MRKIVRFQQVAQKPYSKKLEKQVTVLLGPAIVDYLKNLSKEISILYQTLTNMYLKDCAKNRRAVDLY